MHEEVVLNLERARLFGIKEEEKILKGFYFHFI